MHIWQKVWTIISSFIYSYNYTDDLNSIRPTTEAELDLLELNKSMEQKFIEERLRLRGELDDI